MANCATRTSYAPFVAAEPAPPVAEGEFSSQATEAQAHQDVQAAERAYQSVAPAVSQFESETKPNCESAVLEQELEVLRPIDRLADKYVDMASKLSGDDGEVALDVADEIYGSLLDGYMDLASAYRRASCFHRARFLYGEIVRVYEGESFKKWREEAQLQLNALPASAPVASPDHDEKNKQQISPFKKVHKARHATKRQVS